MNKRFFKLSQGAIKALCAVSVCASLYSCKDDYRLDDEKPSWLGSSIYEYLQQQGNFKTFINLIDDLGYTEDMSRTGSRTLFVADDAAFDEYFTRHNTSYDRLTTSQKRNLINSAMLKNAYLLEMMSSSPNTTDDDNGVPARGQLMRRTTYVSAADCVERFGKDDLPYTFNADEEDYWTRFRKSDKGVLLSLDNTSTMLTQFLPEQMAYKDITDDDFAFIMGRTREKNDAYIYDAKVIQQDITCQNGYIDILDKVLETPQNMAEVIRTSGETKIFSHLLDRFSAPFYDGDLTSKLDGQDSVFVKRYFSLRSQGNKALINDKLTSKETSGKDVFKEEGDNLPLPFDPGWNEYSSGAGSPEGDMAAIFCPSDKAMMEFFFSGGGKFLLNAYASDIMGGITAESSVDNKVLEAIDRVPRNIIRAMVNNLMKPSFASTVPSKYATIKNSASDQMFDGTKEEYRDLVKKTLLANNGVIYVINKVILPAEYAAVSAPAYVDKNKRIFNYAIRAAKLGGIPTTYYAYLLAMGARFTFFTPTDDAFWYVDPVSFNSAGVAIGGAATGKAYKFEWNEKTNKPEAYECSYSYNFATGEGRLGGDLSSKPISATEMENRLKDMLETHTIVHTDDSVTVQDINETINGIACGKHYYTTKNNAILYVDNVALEDEPAQRERMIVKGGWLMQNPNAHQTDDVNNCTVLKVDNKTHEKNGYGNGFTYSITQPMIPTIESVYSTMANNAEFKEFFEMCKGDSLNSILEKLSMTAQAERYSIFQQGNGASGYEGLMCFDHATGAKNTLDKATNVRFFNNYRYTVYVPTNAAIKAATAKGLPTWADITKAVKDAESDKETPGVITEDEKAKIVAQLTALVNFLRYHFQDNAVFADTPALEKHEYETAAMNNETGQYVKLTVHSSGNGTLKVEDANGNVRSVTSDKNLITRDYVIKTADRTISSSSSAVVHGIDGVLEFTALQNGRYDSNWRTPGMARAFINKYKIVK